MVQQRLSAIPFRVLLCNGFRARISPARYEHTRLSRYCLMTVVNPEVCKTNIAIDKITLGGKSRMSKQKNLFALR